MTKLQQKNAIKLLLVAGALAGPLYLFISLAQMFVRDGFDPTRHSWSLLSNGDWGWIHIGNFLLVGMLVIIGAIGVRLVIRGTRGGTWAPLLLGLFGLGLIGSGIFVADPMNGFPIGTLDGPPVEPSMAGVMHIVAGSFGFVGLIGACFVFARRFARQNMRGWSVYSALTGVFFLAAFMGIAGGAQATGVALQVVTLTFTAAVVLGWAWLSTVLFGLTRNRV